MKKAMTSLAASFFAVCAFGTTYTYESAAPATVTTQNIEETIGKLLDDTVDLTINLSPSAKNDNWVWENKDSSFTLNSLTVNADIGRFYLKGAKEYNILIKNNLTVNSNAQWGSMFTALNYAAGTVPSISVEVGGSFSSTGSSAGFCIGHSDNGAMASFKVGGDVTGKINQIRVGGGVATHQASNWDNAGFVVKGILSSTADITSYYTRAAVDSGHLYYKIGGINQSGRWSFDSRMPGENDYTYSHIMITGSAATNSGSAIMSGNILETVSSNSTTGLHNPTVSIVMNSSDGEFVQSFTGSSLGFSGGITVQSGKLLMNFEETSLMNHGNLTMEGGRFGNAGGYTSSFILSDIVYKAGTIALLLDSASAKDMLTLSGTVKLADDAAADAKVNFYFGTNLSWLVDLEGDGTKVISWSKKTSLADETNFSANEYVDGDGNRFVADFLSRDDGLYVKYVAVPEPAAFAVIFGAMALAFAAYRRRK